MTAPSLIFLKKESLLIQGSPYGFLPAQTNAFKTLQEHRTAAVDWLKNQGAQRSHQMK
jgi:hypothetical protein